MKNYFKYVFMFFICFVFVYEVEAKTTLNCEYKGNEFHPYIGNQECIYKIKFVIDGSNVNVSDIKGTKKTLDIEYCKSHKAAFADLGDPEQMLKKYCVSGKRELKFQENKKVNFFLSESDKCPQSIVILNEGTTTNIYTASQQSNYESYNLIEKSDSGKDDNSCGSIEYIPQEIPELTSLIVTIIQIAVPIVLVIMGMLDLFKGITAQKEDEIKKGQQLFIKRLISGALVFFVVIIVKFIISFVANENSNNVIDCMECFINNDCY